jgi:alcohol dehydrogenase (cytochrome c)
MASFARRGERVIKKLAIVVACLGAVSFASPARPGADSAAAAVDVEWPSYNGELQSSRFSPLAGITPENSGDLRVACETTLGDEGALQPGPVMVDKTLYVTTTHTVVAVDAANCKVRWRYVYRAEEEEPFPANRGVAYLDGTLFRGTGDGRLLALDARSGRERWRTKIADPTVVEFLSAAPIAWKGLVFIGPAGSDWGIHGRISAFEAGTGKRVWNFNTIPMKGEPGFESWRIPETAQHGGGGTWSSYSLDPETGELFVPVANPSPDFRPDARPGDDLYTNSIVVLDAMTGKLKWYFQFTRSDGFDYDLAAAPLLYKDAAGHRRIAAGSKDGFLYILDRESHELISKTAITTIKTPASAPTPHGVFACPGSSGGVEWNGPAFDPALNLLYVGSVDWCSVFLAGPARFEPPLIYLGTAPQFSGASEKSGWVYAVDASTGETRWRYHAESPVLSGVTPTAGGVLFSGESAGNLLLFDAQSGRLLKKENLGGSLGGGIVTYRIGGQQYVATTAGNVSRSGLGTGGDYVPRLIVLTTGLAPGYQILKSTAVPPGRSTEHFGGELGKSAYDTYCAGCHGSRGEGGEGGPSLTSTSSRMQFAALVAWIRNPTPPMPKMVPPITNPEVDAIAHYVEKMK